MQGFIERATISEMKLFCNFEIIRLAIYKTLYTFSHENNKNLPCLIRGIGE